MLLISTLRLHKKTPPKIIICGLAAGIIIVGDCYFSYYEKIGEIVTNISEEIPFTIPDGWQYSRLSNVGSIVMGSSPSGTSINNESIGIEFHQGKICFTDMYITKSDKYTTEPTRIAEANSVLLCVRAPVGTTNITDREICVGRGLSAIKPLSNISLLFLYYYLNVYKQRLILQGTGSTFDAITANIVKNILLPVPPLCEQQKIVAAIQSHFDLLDSIKKSLE